jgi:hypothetical protein
MLHTRTYSHPTDNHWRAATAAQTGAHARLLACTCTTHLSPTGSHWHAATAAQVGAHTELQTCSCTYSTRSRWHAATEHSQVPTFGCIHARVRIPFPPATIRSSPLQHRQVPTLSCRHARVWGYVFHGQPLARSRCRTARCPPLAASTHVPESHGQPLACSHCSTARCPP